MTKTVGRLITGAKSNIDTTEVQLTSTTTECVLGVLVVADDANTGIVYVGPKGVTAGTADVTDGVRLDPGDSITIEIDDASKVYLIASAAGQKVYFVAV